VGEEPGKFARLLHRHRLAAGLTQEELAEQSGLSVRAVSDLERGRTRSPFARTVRLLADALELAEPVRAELMTARRADADEQGQPESPVRPSSGPRPTVVPHQLPAAVSHFVGRASELKALWNQLDECAADRTVVIAAICGSAGVGKTALAVHWAHLVAAEFADGQLYVNLNGFGPSGPPVHPADAIRAFLQALGLAPEQIPADSGAQAALYRSLLTGRRVLIILDNVSSPDQARPLLPGSPGCMVLVTSRAELTGLAAAEDAHLLPVDVLTEEEATDLLARRLGHDRTAAEPAAVTELVTVSARLPLALAIVAARAAARPGFPLTALAGEVRDADGILDALDAGDAVSSVRSVFSWSYRLLGEAAARMFRLLALHHGPDISLAAAASLARAGTVDARKTLAELAAASMISEHKPGRYAFHDLLRAYAADQSASVDSKPVRRAAVARVLDHYLHSASQAAQLLDPARDTLTLRRPLGGTSPELPSNYDQALSWFDVEYPVLLGAVRLATEARLDEYAWQLPSVLMDYCYLRGHWPGMAATQEAALAAAARSADAAGQALAYRNLARAHVLLGESDDADTCYRRALARYEQLADQAGQARCHYGLAQLAHQRGNLVTALTHGQAMLAGFRDANRRDGQAIALNAIGWYSAQMGQHDQAIAYCQRALDLCRELGDRHTEAATLDSLGYVRHQRGEYAEAVGCYRLALDLFRDLRDSSNEAATLINLGQAQQDFGDALAARTSWERALAILDDLHHPAAGHLRARMQAVAAGTS
jgi:tetratricopeptide (TPR) repeat protein/transcriptional regulator with XRE-family HTH domain